VHEEKDSELGVEPGYSYPGAVSVDHPGLTAVDCSRLVYLPGASLASSLIDQECEEPAESVRGAGEELGLGNPKLAMRNRQRYVLTLLLWEWLNTLALL
jgi:hypothetical protein